MSDTTELQIETCYMCERPATTREHAPPQCFFPKQVDQPAHIRKDLRTNLIVVPSCDIHNSQKSSNDEYVRFVICSTFNGNEYKRNHWDKKVLKSFQKKHGKFKKFAPELIPVVLEAPDGTREESAAIRVDQREFDDAIEHIGRALHCHHFGEKAPTYSIIHTAEFLDVSSDNREEVNQVHRDLQDLVDRGFENEPKHGENPEVFYYQVKVDEGNNPIFSMTFYETMKVTAGFSLEEPEGVRRRRLRRPVRDNNPGLREAVRRANRSLIEK
ncbi:MAG: hypothetical protein V7746_02765 [Halioglobus sp.]